MPINASAARLVASPEEIIDEARNGRMVILVDDEDRENEGDLFIPAQFCTPQAIAFMAVHGRGLICLTLTEQRVRDLGLAPMTDSNGTRHGTAFTSSIEARDGIETGISAADRARTVATAINGANGPEAIVTPGHMFPLIARDGGVLVRAGHTEAAVDLARLAGLNPSGVICEVIKDDGTMARLDDLVRFGNLHGLKIGTIRDLIAYRRRHDNLVERVASAPMPGSQGLQGNMIAYRNRLDGSESLAIVRGRIDPTQPTLVRMHRVDPFRDLLAARSAETSPLDRAMRMIEQAEAGVVVLLRGPSWSDSIVKRTQQMATEGELREYGIGAQILADLAVHDVILISNSDHLPVAIEGYGIRIVEQRSY
ncbi:MAG: 3,4-dihydroxy-2-butanone-4-phosphate synthase [Sphingomonas sp.]|nr:3,4-dihydroxy-2-butanone-4-phosphate synthase [Sphingomonas sp.]